MANKDFLFRAKADTSNYDANLAKARQQLDGFAKANLSAGGAIKQLSSSLVSVAARFASVTAAVAAVGSAFRSNISTALGFEKSMSQLSSLTGMVGKDLEKLKGYAIDLGSTTTLSASQVADAFKLIGSQQPQLLASSEALKSVTKNAITLAEAAGIELADAARTLSVSINQMGGDSANAERYINVLAAASQKGAGDIAWLGEAITKSGTTAKAVGTDYEELVANLEQLAKAGYDASTAGTALRSIIMNLEKKASNEFKPSVVGLTQAFENLGKANLSLTEYQELAGKMFASQAKALAEASGEAKKMREEITGTNIAEEQAKTNTDNLDGSLKSLASAWEGLNLHINDSNGFLRTCVDWLKDVVKWADQTFTSAGRAAAQLERLRGGQQGSDNDIVQKDLNKVMSAPEADKQAVYEQIAATYTESENAKWRKVNEAKARLNSLGKYDPFGEKAKLEETIKKNTEWAEQFRTLGEEFRSKGQQYLDSLKPIEEIVEPTPTASDTQSSTSGKSKRSIEKTAKELSPLQQAQKEISALTEEALTADEARRKVIKEEIADLQKQVEEYKKIQDYVTGKVTAAQVSEAKVNKPLTVDEMRAKAQADLEAQNTAVDSSIFSALLKDSVKSGVDVGNLLDSANLEIQAGIDIPDETWQSILDKYNELKAAIGEEPIQIDFNTGKIATDGKKAEDTWKNAASAVQSVGSAFSQIEDPGVKAVGTVMQAIASIALGFAQAAASPAVTSTGWGWIAYLAAGAAAMATTIATIHSLTGFAEGGIVQGNAYSGDNVGPVMLDAGELILNRSQQGTLAEALTNGNNQGGAVGGTPYVTGEKIVLGINNYARRAGLGELVFSR